MTQYLFWVLKIQIKNTPNFQVFFVCICGLVCSRHVCNGYVIVDKINIENQLRRLHKAGAPKLADRHHNLTVLFINGTKQRVHSRLLKNTVQNRFFNHWNAQRVVLSSCAPQEANNLLALITSHRAFCLQTHEVQERTVELILVP